MTAQHAKFMINYKQIVLSDIEKDSNLWEKLKNAKFIERKTNEAIAKEFFINKNYKWEIATLSQIVADYFASLSVEEQNKYKKIVKDLSSRKNIKIQSELAKRSVEARWQIPYSDEEKLIIFDAKLKKEWFVTIDWREKLALILNELPDNKEKNVKRVAKNIRTWYNKNKN